MVVPKRNLTLCALAAMGVATLAMGAASSAGANSYSIDNVSFDNGTRPSGFVSLGAGGHPDGYRFTTANGAITGYDYRPTANPAFGPGAATVIIYRDAPLHAFAQALTGPGPDTLVVGPNGLSFECNADNCKAPAADQWFLVESGLPEATTWATLLVGFGGVGGLMRTARRKTTAA